MRALMLASADVRILIIAITFFTLLLILLAPDGYLGPGFMDSGWIPAPLPEWKALSRRLGRVVIPVQ
jgi:hypothetical protein